MSYSRWSNSFWYTYWTGPVDRDEAQFEICGVTSFTAKQMRENIDGCLAAVNKVDFDPRQPTTSEMAELRGYMQEFLREVDERCPAPKCQHEYHGSEWAKHGGGYAVEQICIRCGHRDYSHKIGVT